MDAVLDMLRAMRLSGGLFLDAEFTAPWCVTAHVGPEDCRPFAPVPRHIIAYHYVAAGRLLLAVDGHPPVAVAGGEIVVLPRNDPHVIGSAVGLRPVSADHLIRPAPGGGLARIVHGGGGERTHVLCGFLGDDRPPNAVVAMLPRVLTLAVADGASASWIESSLRFAADQLAAGRVSSPAIVGKLAELLFMEAVRRYLATRPAAPDGWAAALGDPQVGRALALMHGGMARRWTTEDLAQAVGLSRSAFAERFARAVGEPPMHYLARQRLEEASLMLRDTGDSLARIAYAVGYESEAAFNRAFRRAYGVPPADWRRRHAAGGGAVEERPPEDGGDR